MLLAVTTILLSATSPMEKLTEACMHEGQGKPICQCYAGFIQKHSTKREFKALATLVEPQNRTDIEKAFRALLAAGLTPTEIFSIGMKVENLQDAATKACEGK